MTEKIYPLRPPMTTDVQINDYRETWLSLRYVYACFGDGGGDPGPEWDMDGDDVIYEQDTYGNEYRDPDDLVTTIIFKQIDP